MLYLESLPRLRPSTSTSMSKSRSKLLTRFFDVTSYFRSSPPCAGGAPKRMKRAGSTSESESESGSQSGLGLEVDLDTGHDPDTDSDPDADVGILIAIFETGYSTPELDGTRSAEYFLDDREGRW
jgi:hypothetical protein